MLHQFDQTLEDFKRYRLENEELLRRKKKEIDDLMANHKKEMGEEKVTHRKEIDDLKANHGKQLASETVRCWMRDISLRGVCNNLNGEMLDEKV